MAKKQRLLLPLFRPVRYRLELSLRRQQWEGRLRLSGHKTGRPSHRLTLHAKGLEILQAELEHHGKKGTRRISAARINHHRSFEEVRLHTVEALYPGAYNLNLAYQSRPQRPAAKLARLKSLKAAYTGLAPSELLAGIAGRELLPCIDEPQAAADFSIRLTAKNKHEV